MKGGELRQRVLFDSNKKILLCKMPAQQTLRTTALTGNICPRDSDKFYLIQINLLPESGFQNLDTLTSPRPFELKAWSVRLYLNQINFRIVQDG